MYRFLLTSGKMNEKKALFQRQDNPEDDTQLVIVSLINQFIYAVT